MTMKNKSILSLFTFVLSAMMLASSCEDMLTPDLDRYATEDQYGKDSIYSALGVLRSIQNVAERNVLLGECRGDLVTAGDYTTDSIGNIINFGEMENGSSALLNVADYYHVVNSCNFYLANVDTTITQNNQKIMQREWAQVQAMRAWAYIQLVRLYGEVPFVTVPVASTDQAEALQHSAPRVNASNLADMLVEAGLRRALEVQNALGMPDYGSFAGGGGSYNAKLNLFPVQIVLGDAYLMKHDYASAASSYYDYFKFSGNNPSISSSRQAARAQEMNFSGISSKLVSSGNLDESVGDDAMGNGQIITSVTSARTSADGRVLETLFKVTGFRMEKGNLQADERNLQVLPSKQFLTLGRAQHFNKFTVDDELMKREEFDGGDGRRLAWAPELSFPNGNKQNIVSKYVKTSSSITDNSNLNRISGRNYQIPLYRTTSVLLRYAEAVNRLGFPQLAFGILKDGLVTENIPALLHVDYVLNDTIFKYNTEDEDVISIDTIPFIVIGNVTSVSAGNVHIDYRRNPDIVVYEAGDEKICVGDTILLEPYDGDIDELGSGIANLTLADIPEDVQASWYSKLNLNALNSPLAMSGGMYYLSFEERKAMDNYPFLDFFSTDANIWSDESLNNAFLGYGIHGRGCGNVAGIQDTVYTYARQVAEKIAEDRLRRREETGKSVQEYAQELYRGDTLLVDDKEEIINAVENLIVDESALESAFEGHRFTDLIRIAGHKNNPYQPKTGFKVEGVDWLAWKVARRNMNYTDPVDQVEKELEAKLKDKTNWYLPMP